MGKIYRSVWKKAARSNKKHSYPLWIWYVGTEELYPPFPHSVHINFESHITAQQSPLQRWKESKRTRGKEALPDSMKQWRAGRVWRQTVAEGIPVAKTSMLRLWEGWEGQCHTWQEGSAVEGNVWTKWRNGSDVVAILCILEKLDSTDQKTQYLECWNWWYQKKKNKSELKGGKGIILVLGKARRWSVHSTEHR